MLRIIRWSLCLALAAASVSQARLPLRVIAGGGSSSWGTNTVLTASDFWSLYTITVPQSGLDIGAIDIQHLAGRVVSGATHLFVTQGSTGGFVGKWSAAELIDPGSSATATVYANWGYSGGVYDMYQGLFGKTYDSGGSLVANGGSVDANLPVGISWHDVTATCCYYLEAALNYGNYVPSYTKLVVDLTNKGTGGAQPTGLSTTTYGPFRVCAGQIEYNDSTQECGPNHAAYLLEMPDGSMGVASGGSATQQGGRISKGPALFGGGTWLTSATTQGFGSTRGTAAYRTTDIIVPDEWIAHYSIDQHVALNGTMSGGYPVTTMRRPPRSGTHTYNHYWYEGYLCTTVPGATAGASQIDPNADNTASGVASGNGSFTDNDGPGGVALVTGTKEGFLEFVNGAMGPTWYKTVSCPDLRRNTAEYHTNFEGPTGSANDDVDWIAASAERSSTPFAYGLRMRYVDPGTANASLTVGVSGHDVTVNLATNGSSVVTTTAAQAASAVNASGSANVIMTGTAGGTGAGVLAATGYAYVGGGPQNSPIENIDCGVTVTGPQACDHEPFFCIYAPASLQLSTSYSRNWSECVFLKDIEPSLTFSTANSTEGKISVWYNSAARRLYVMAVAADTVSSFGSAKPFIHVFGVAGTTAPSPLSAVLSAMGIVLANLSAASVVMIGLRRGVPWRS